jgi:hypothetical protein
MKNPKTEPVQVQTSIPSLALDELNLTIKVSSADKETYEKLKEEVSERYNIKDAKHLLSLMEDCRNFCKDVASMDKTEYDGLFGPIKKERKKSL